MAPKFKEKELKDVQKAIEKVLDANQRLSQEIVVRGIPELTELSEQNESSLRKMLDIVGRWK
jgi:hypothetical protein